MIRFHYCNCPYTGGHTAIDVGATSESSELRSSSYFEYPANAVEGLYVLQVYRRSCPNFRTTGTRTQSTAAKRKRKKYSNCCTQITWKREENDRSTCVL